MGKERRATYCEVLGAEGGKPPAARQRGVSGAASGPRPSQSAAVEAATQVREFRMGYDSVLEL